MYEIGTISFEENRHVYHVGTVFDVMPSMSISMFSSLHRQRGHKLGSIADVHH